MNSYIIKFTFLLIFLFFTGCASYKIPIQSDSHPASSDATVSQIELSPILDISDSSRIEIKENYDQHYH